MHHSCRLHPLVVFLILFLLFVFHYCGCCPLLQFIFFFQNDPIFFVAFTGLHLTFSVLLFFFHLTCFMLCIVSKVVLIFFVLPLLMFISSLLHTWIPFEVHNFFSFKLSCSSCFAMLHLVFCSPLWVFQSSLFFLFYWTLRDFIPFSLTFSGSHQLL